MLAAVTGHFLDVRFHAIEIDAQNGRIEVVLVDSNERLRHEDDPGILGRDDFGRNWKGRSVVEVTANSRIPPNRFLRREADFDRISAGGIPLA
jgi:hypothetical protein